MYICMYICIYRWVCTTCARRRISASSRGNIFSKVLYILALYRKYARALTFENVCEVVDTYSQKSSF